jgi:ferric-dicitrate binding protein FerR (iron transport regulator)
MDRAIRGELDTAGQVELDRHLAACEGCAAELEAARLLRSSLAPQPKDDALNFAAVEMVLGRVQDEALDLSAVDGAMDRLQHHERLGDKLRRLLGFGSWVRPTAFAALGAAAAVVAVWFTVRPGSHATPPTVAQPQPSHSVVLDDGSEVTPADGNTAIQLAEQSPSQTTVRLWSGDATFRIRHDSRRLFRVTAGPFQIEDLGTVFRVVHQQKEGTIRVAVSEGRVAILHAASRLRVELGAGDDRVFAAPESAPAAKPPLEEPAELPTAPVTGSPPATHAPSHTADTPAKLLLAADVARNSGKPEAAVEPLRRLLKRYPSDPRAPSAAFTLGWLLLMDLGRAREAAVAFTEAERIAPRGTLAEDAAARVAEAWQKAGDTHRASEAARRYQQMYPSGRYTSLMRSLIGEH